jgi:hypothetical protein
MRPTTTEHTMTTKYKTSITKSRAGHYTVSILAISELTGRFYSVKKQHLIDNIYKARAIAQQLIQELNTTV